MRKARSIFTPKTLRELQSEIDYAYKTTQRSDSKPLKRIIVLANELASPFEKVMIRRTSESK